MFFDVAGLRPDSVVAELGVTAGAALLAPHRCYLPIVRPLLEREHVKGLAHITGGGITENVPRIFPERCGAKIDLTGWAIAALFQFIRDRGILSRDEMYRTFNMGIGLVVVCAARERRLRHQRRGASRQAERGAYRRRRPRPADGALPPLKLSCSPIHRPLSRRIGVLISGRGSNLQSMIDATSEGQLDAQIAIVVSNCDDAAGLKRASEAGIETMCLRPRDYPGRDAYDRALAGALDTHRVNLVCLAGFMRLVGPPLLTAFPNRMLNVHPSCCRHFRVWTHSGRHSSTASASQARPCTW